MNKIASTIRQAVSAHEQLASLIVRVSSVGTADIATIFLVVDSDALLLPRKVLVEETRTCSLVDIRTATRKAYKNDVSEFFMGTINFAALPSSLAEGFSSIGNLTGEVSVEPHLSEGKRNRLTEAALLEEILEADFKGDAHLQEELKSRISTVLYALESNPEKLRGSGVSFKGENYRRFAEGFRTAG